MATSLVQQAQSAVHNLLSVQDPAASHIQAAAPIQFRRLQPHDFVEFKAAHAALFPIDYEDNFFHRATNALDRIWSCAAVTMDPYSVEQLAGFITAKSVFLHEVDASDRQHMGLLSPVLDHDRVLYIMTLGVVEGQRNRGIASSLISIACQHAYEARCRAVFLHVITYNTAAMSLYSRQGFSCVAKLRGFYFIATGRTPDPQQQVYDAYLFVQHVGGAAGVPSPWDLVSLAWSPLRLAFNRIHSCMPGFCRPDQQPQQHAKQQPSPADPVSPWDDSTSSSSNQQTVHTSYQQQLQQQQQQQQSHLVQPSSQQWHSEQLVQLAPGSRQRHRGPSLPSRQCQQQEQQMQRHAVEQQQQQLVHHPMYCQQQQLKQHGWQQLGTGLLPQQQHNHHHQQQQQQHMLHQGLHPPQQRMLRWLFNGASRGSIADACEQQQRPQSTPHTSRQDWQSAGDQHKQV